MAETPELNPVPDTIREPGPESGRDSGPDTGAGPGPIRRFTIAEALPALEGEGVVRFRNTDVTACKVDGKRIFFATDMSRDPIQRKHRHGVFFEQEEMEMLRAHIKKGDTFVDIGSNVGNHSIFAGVILGAGRIIPFEPNPPAYRLLTLNLMLNRLEDVASYAFIGMGVSDTAQDGFGMTDRQKNLGAAQMVAGEGDVSTVVGDTALAGETPGFIKIDVEGMEMNVLRGLEQTVARCRPVILVEVDRKNADAFEQWRKDHDYDIAAEVRHYAANQNFLLIPSAGTEAAK